MHRPGRRFEGLRTTAYPDPATGREPWTVCYGETAGVKRGDTYTVAQCKAMLARSLEGYALKLEGCVTRPMADETYAAFLASPTTSGPAASAGPPSSGSGTPASPAPPATRC